MIYIPASEYLARWDAAMEPTDHELVTDHSRCGGFWPECREGERRELPSMPPCDDQVQRRLPVHEHECTRAQPGRGENHQGEVPPRQGGAPAEKERQAMILRLGFIAGLLGFLASIVVPATVAVVLLFFTLGLTLTTIAADRVVLARRRTKGDTSS